MTWRTGSAVMSLYRPGFQELEKPGGTAGPQGYHLLQAGTPQLAGLTGAALGVWRAADHLKIGLVLVSGVARGIAAVGFVAFAEGRALSVITASWTCCSGVGKSILLCTLIAFIAQSVPAFKKRRVAFIRRQ